MLAAAQGTRSSGKVAARTGGVVKRVLVGVPLVAVVCATMLLGAFGSGVAVAQTCPNEAFRTGLSSKLPDCRAYEKVSPADKNGGDVQAGAGGPLSPGDLPQPAAGGVVVSAPGG